MFSLPLYVFLIIYSAFLAIFAVFAFVNIFHIIETGTLTGVSFIVTFLSMALTALALYATWYFLQNTDWQQAVVIWNSDWLKGVLIFNNVPNIQ